MITTCPIAKKGVKISDNLAGKMFRCPLCDGLHRAVQPEISESRIVKASRYEIYKREAPSKWFSINKIISISAFVL